MIKHIFTENIGVYLGASGLTCCVFTVFLPVDGLVTALWSSRLEWLSKAWERNLPNKQHICSARRWEWNRRSEKLSVWFDGSHLSERVTAQAQEKVRPDDMRWCWRDRIGRIRRYKWIKSSLDFIWTRFSSLATQTLPTKTELQLTSPPASSHWEVIFFSSPRNLFLSSATQLSAEAKKLYMTAVHGVQKSSSISPQKPERPETPKVWTKRASKTVQRRFLKPPPVIPQITSRCSQSYYFFDKCYCLVINLSLKQT